MRTLESWHLTTERLSLRPVQVSETEEFFPLFCDPVISKDMAWTAHTDRDQSRQFLIDAENAFKLMRAVHWAVRHQGSLVGLFSLIDLRARHRSIDYNRAELAYWLSPSHQRRGFMTEAGIAVVDFSFTQMNLNKLIVSHHAGNTASERLIRKLGFRFLYLEQEAFSKNGMKIDVHHYDLLHSSWQKNRITD